MKKYIYQSGPIDFWTGWNGLTCLQARANTDNPYTESVYFKNYLFKGRETTAEYLQGFDYADKIKDAIRLIREFTAWEGDGYFYVTAQPNDDFMIALCFAIKQSNNGTTFLCSDYPIENLKHCLVKVWYASSQSKLKKLPSLKDIMNQNDEHSLF